LYDERARPLSMLAITVGHQNALGVVRPQDAPAPAPRSSVQTGQRSRIVAGKTQGYTTMRYRICVVCLLPLRAGCGTAYKATPVGFELPERYPNAQQIAGATVGAVAYADPRAAGEAFGFDVIDAGLLPVQVAFDHRGGNALAINPGQTFLENEEGRLWPVLNERFAYERVTRYAETKRIFRQGSYGAFLGGVAGALVGAAVGVVSGEDVGRSAAKGAATGAAGGGVIGGSAGAASAGEARRAVMEDFNEKSLRNREIKPGELAYGFIFFPAEAATARSLRLQLIDQVTKQPYTVTFQLSP